MNILKQVPTSNEILNIFHSKKHYLLIIILSISYIAIGRSPLASQKQIGMFLNSTTCVVLENETNPYNAFIKDAVEKYWKITPFEFITATEFESRRLNSRYSFIVLLESTYDKDPSGVSYSCLSLVLGCKSTDITKMPELSSIPLLYTDDNEVGYGFAIPAIIKFAQNHVKTLEKKRFFISLYGLSYYNTSGFKDKELLMNKEKMAYDASSVEKIAVVYPYVVKLLSVKEIQEVIALNPANTLFHLHVGPNQTKGVGKSFDLIFDVDGGLYFYNTRKITNRIKEGFSIKDFKRIR